eukprot:gnl/Chilomastix_cuspidata/6690.p1 GENE.gnl/Chilomastix_cuspidata/6690~~gnl/Chilomastix_cuspidata/6690.p1  ORF type:complete len:172 (-),score=63.29 gnl/Chilomastix_cuspidata/6690:104-619(-)
MRRRITVPTHFLGRPLLLVVCFRSSQRAAAARAAAMLLAPCPAFPAFVLHVAQARTHAATVTVGQLCAEEAAVLHSHATLGAGEAHMTYPDVLAWLRAARLAQFGTSRPLTLLLDEHALVRAAFAGPLDSTAEAYFLEKMQYLLAISAHVTERHVEDAGIGAQGENSHGVF